MNPKEFNKTIAHMFLVCLRVVGIYYTVELIVSDLNIIENKNLKTLLRVALSLLLIEELRGINNQIKHATDHGFNIAPENPTLQEVKNVIQPCLKHRSRDFCIIQ